ncbi:NADPH-dependent FMN reductase [Actinopolyspora mortivallis]|uniref:FMN reductase n=1 Tax=Actinopolyspora mortivallis TaxID=33906 RepID=A0A2T0GYL8_ACTMO|nr:NAD(P)H-dependent oxidoreductase [Actinopolyspora mortivallis]PRW64215.1 FMN reductase [Actinopolyspora mortivallis]
MPEDPVKLAVVIGSVRDGRIGPTVAEWFALQARHHGEVEVDVVDLADYPLPLNMPSPDELDAKTQEAHRGLKERLAQSDAFVVVTAEYNHTIPPGLSNSINWYLNEWKAKPVGLVSYGGMAGGIRAAEHLRQVFAEVHAITVRDMLSFHNPWGKFDSTDPTVAPEGSEAAAKALLDQLVWWGRTLRNGRKNTPYVA